MGPNVQIGFELFFTTPRQVDKMPCLVCGTNCDDKRNVYEPANFEMAQAKISDLYNVFSCLCWLLARPLNFFWVFWLKFRQTILLLDPEWFGLFYKEQPVTKLAHHAAPEELKEKIA
jgi:hypothetical protein